MMIRTPAAGRRRPARSHRARAAWPAQTSAWRRSFDGDPPERCRPVVGSFSISASASYSTIASRSSLRFSRLCSDVDGRHAPHRTARPARAYDVAPARLAVRTHAPRYPSAADVGAAMPRAERLALAERTMTALVAEAELPPKIGVHPRPEGSFAHAMPAAPARAPDGAAICSGSSGSPGSRRTTPSGCRPSTRVVVLSDPTTGRADRHPGRRPDHGRAHGRRVGRGHPAVRDRATLGRPARRRSSAPACRATATSRCSGMSLPGVELTVHDRHPDRANGLAPRRRADPGIAAAATAAIGPRGGRRDADVVITAASFAARSARS